MSKVQKVMGNCPMGCGATLFLADGGHVTCSWVDCPNPAAPDELLRADVRDLPTTTRNPQDLVARCTCEHGRWAHSRLSGECMALNCACKAYVSVAGRSELETVQLAGRFIEGAKMLERAGSDKGAKAMRRARRLADGMRLQALTVALGLEDADDA